jgi:hypothetical protein
LAAANIAVVEGERVAATRRLPAESGLCKSTLAALLGEVEVDVIEALAAVMVSPALPWCVFAPPSLAWLSSPWKQVMEGWMDG